MVVVHDVIAGPLTLRVQAPEHLMDDLPPLEPVGSGALATLHVSFTQSLEHAGTSGTVCSWDEDLCTFETPFYTGHVSFRSHEAVIRLAPTDEVLETQERRIYGSLRLLFSLWCREQGGLTLHGCSLEKSGRAYIFLGKSGVGKTTLVHSSAPCPVLGDDLVALLPDDTGKFKVWPNPFGGRERVPVSWHTPLSIARIGLLEQATVTRMEQTSREKAVRGILEHMFQFDHSTVQRNRSLALGCKIANDIPVEIARVRQFESPLGKELRI